jgi:hypothetical protein
VTVRDSNGAAVKAGSVVEWPCICGCGPRRATVREVYEATGRVSCEPGQSIPAANVVLIERTDLTSGQNDQKSQAQQTSKRRQSDATTGNSKTT